MTTTNPENSQVRTNSYTRAISPNELHNLQASPKHKQLEIKGNDFIGYPKGRKVEMSREHWDQVAPVFCVSPYI